MIGNIAGFLVLILVTLLFIWLLVHSLRSQHKILKWFGVFITGGFFPCCSWQLPHSRLLGCIESIYRDQGLL